MLIKKLFSRRGETYVELLVSVALLALAMAMLTGMLATAYRLDMASREGDKDINEQLQVAELYEGVPDTGTVTVTGGGTGPASISVNIYGEKGSLQSYKKEASGG